VEEYSNQKFHIMKRGDTMKKEIVIVLFAIILCSFFGLGYLALFSDQPLLAAKEASGSNTSTFHIYVNQVGVYSSKENANIASNEMSGIVSKTYILEKNNQFILISLITKEESEATQQKQNLEQTNISVFTKEYDVSNELSECFTSGDFSLLLTELESR